MAGENSCYTVFVGGYVRGCYGVHGFHVKESLETRKTSLCSQTLLALSLSLVTASNWYALRTRPKADLPDAYHLRLRKIITMSNLQNDPLLPVETTCESLLYELQMIWDEVGELDADRDKMLLELEKECLEVYRRKVNHANKNRAQLRQDIADSEAELAAICSSMAERPVHIRQADQNAGCLKEELRIILPQVEEMRKRKLERKNQFLEVLRELKEISGEINGSYGQISLDDCDLSLRKLEELHRQLHSLQKEKSHRLNQVQKHIDTLKSLCSVMGLEFNKTISEIHPTFVDGEALKDISASTIHHLSTTIHKLRELKLQRMQKLQDLGASMLELWNLMDTPLEEQQMFQSVTCNIAASEHEMTQPNALSMDFINSVEEEVSQLEALKSSKMKELVLKKRSELEEICRKTHMIPEPDSAIELAIEAVDSGNVDPAMVLEQIELQIANAKEEAFSRKDVLEKIEKWMAACDEESWLEEYNRDENRYNAGRGAHLTLKRAEKARSLVNKLPALLETLASRTIAWEKERGVEFCYDGIQLLSMLEQYNMLRQEKEEEKRRQRDHKKLQEQLIAEQEVLYGTKPSPSRPQSVKKTPRFSSVGVSNRRLSLGGAALQNPKSDLHHANKTAVHPRPTAKASKLQDEVAAAFPAKKQASAMGPTNASKGRHELPNVRKPFSPISPNAPPPPPPPPPPSSSSSSLRENGPAGHPTVSESDETVGKTPPPNDLVSFSTPKKPARAAEEENKTPVGTPILAPTPPSAMTVVPMQTAMTPAPSLPLALASYPAEEVEYSFEERRAGFVLPRFQVDSTVARV